MRILDQVRCFWKYMYMCPVKAGRILVCGIVHCSTLDFRENYVYSVVMLQKYKED